LIRALRQLVPHFLESFTARLQFLSLEPCFNHV
jgi:hypothetical protein